MTVNLHTHTYRCHHATGTERQYIQKAIENGIKHMGFSEHSPFREPNGTEQPHRLSMMDAPLYFESLRSLREEFGDRIQIHIGFEMEFYPLHFEKMLDVATSLGAEYLILGQHWIRYGEENVHTSRKPTDQEEDLACYVDLLIDAMQTGVFTYVAHPDILNFLGEDSVYERHMRRLCQAAIQYNVPLELNFLGIRENRHYPHDRFWKIAGEEGCEVVYGFDSHAFKNAYDGDSLKIAQEITLRYGLRYNPYPTMIHPVTKKRTVTTDSTKKS